MVAQLSSSARMTVSWSAMRSRETAPKAAAAHVVAAFEFLAAPGHLTGDGRRALSQRLEPSTGQTGLRDRSSAGLIRAIGAAVHAATPFRAIGLLVVSSTASLLGGHPPEGMSGSHRDRPSPSRWDDVLGT